MLKMVPNSRRVRMRLKVPCIRAVRPVGEVVGQMGSRAAASGWIAGQTIHADGGANLVDTLMPLEIQRG
jgi:hypothetical protein